MVLDHTEEHGSQWATICSIAGKLGMTSGTIVGKVRDTGAAHPLFGVVEDMDEINVYTRRYHHGDDANVEQESISEAELHGFVKKSLAIIGCC
jgi:hypothetical protein